MNKIMRLFKKKIKINSKFKKGDFIAFHMNNDLKHGMISEIRMSDDKILYDIKVGGEATWLCKGIKEDDIVRLNHD